MKKLSAETTKKYWKKSYHVGLTGKIYFESTPMSCRMYNFLIAGKRGRRDWIRHRERERLGYHKCYS